eukprot:SAG22_NODE_310_length_12645_cov_20.450183_9_plen_393_part_00
MGRDEDPCSKKKKPAPKASGATAAAASLAIACCIAVLFWLGVRGSGGTGGAGRPEKQPLLPGGNSWWEALPYSSEVAKAATARIVGQEVPMYQGAVVAHGGIQNTAIVFGGLDGEPTSRPTNTMWLVVGPGKPEARLGGGAGGGDGRGGGGPGVSVWGVPSSEKPLDFRAMKVPRFAEQQQQQQPPPLWPAARLYAAAWIDVSSSDDGSAHGTASRNTSLYIFGGSGNWGDMQDLWRWDYGTMQWDMVWSGGHVAGWECDWLSDGPALAPAELPQAALTYAGQTDWPLARHAASVATVRSGPAGGSVFMFGGAFFIPDLLQKDAAAMAALQIDKDAAWEASGRAGANVMAPVRACVRRFDCVGPGCSCCYTSATPTSPRTNSFVHPCLHDIV